MTPRMLLESIRLLLPVFLLVIEKYAFVFGFSLRLIFDMFECSDNTLMGSVKFPTEYTLNSAVIKLFLTVTFGE